MHEQPLRVVPPKRVVFVFFGPSDLVRSRASFLQIVSHGNLLSVLQRAAYNRQRSQETGKPFLLLSVYNASDISAIVKFGTVSFACRCNEALKHRSCRIAPPRQPDAPIHEVPRERLTKQTNPTTRTAATAVYGSHS